MSLRKLAAVATCEAVRVARVGPPSRVPGSASPAFVQTGAFAQTSLHPHGFARAFAVAGSRAAPASASFAALRASRALRASARHGSSKAAKHKLASPALPSSTPRPSGAATDVRSALPTRASAQSLHLAVENAYLNWVRNGITATALGMAFVHFRVATDDAEFSIGGAVVQTMGALYVALGAASYVSSAFFLRRELALTTAGAAWYAANAVWPLAMYATGVLCLLDWHPTWLLALLAANAHVLPTQWQDRCLRVVGDEAARREARSENERRKKTPAPSWGES